MIEEFLVWAAELANYRSLLDDPKKADEPKHEIVKVDPPSCAAYFDQQNHRPSGEDPKLTMVPRTINY